MVKLLACGNPRRHGYIKVHTIQVHHVLPKSWGGTDRSPNLTGTAEYPNNTVPLCGLCHDNAHALLNLYMHAAKEDHLPGREDLKTFDPYIKELCLRAWVASDPSHRAYTVAAPESTHKENRPNDSPSYTDAPHGADPGEAGQVG